MNLPQDIELLYILVLKELKVRYKSSILGYLWALLNPFAFAIVYFVAFKIIMRVNMPNYSTFLLSGMFPWMWLANSLTHSSGTYRSNASLVKRVNLPRFVLPLSNVVHEMVHFCLALPVLLAFILLTGGDCHASWIWQIPCMVVLQLCFVYPIALLLAILNVFVKDIEYLVGIGLSMLFFLTPIVYPIHMIPHAYRSYFDYSPLVALMEGWHSVLLEGTFVYGKALGSFVSAVLVGGLALYVYQRKGAKIGELL